MGGLSSCGKQTERKKFMPKKSKMPGVQTPQAIKLGSEDGKDYRQACKYGEDCYQKNPMHHQKFRHPKPEGSEEKNVEEEPQSKEEIKTPSPKKPRIEELTKKAPEVVEDEVQCTPTKCKFESEDMTEEFEVIEETPEPVPAFADWPKDPVLSVEEKFLVKMPEDFMAFWDFCKGINRENPREALLKSCGLILVGPYDIVAGDEFKSTNLNDYLCHYRYYRDPPEFQTVIASSSEDDNFHVGYYRDDPKDVPVFVAAYGGKTSAERDNYKFTLLGDNLFAAIYAYLGQLINKADPFKMTSLQKLKGSVHVHATMKNQDQSFPLEVKTTAMKCRDKKRVAATFHGAGMVVPYDKESQVGYREIPETVASLKKILSNVNSAKTTEEKNKAFDVLQELVTNVQFANDEGDPGMGLELGLDLLLFGGNRLNSTIRHLLSVAYGLLNRDPFAKIANAHLNRRKSNVEFFKAE